MTSRRPHHPASIASTPKVRIGLCPSCRLPLHRKQLQPHRSLSATPPKHVKNRFPYRSITKKELDLITAARASRYPHYAPEEKALLKHVYTPDQIAAIEAGEAAIPPTDLASQGRFRADPLQFQYMDPHGFSRVQPVIDKRLSRLQGKWRNYDDDESSWLKERGTRPLDVDEIMENVGRVLADPNEHPYDAELSERVRRVDPGTGKARKGVEKGDVSAMGEFADMWRSALAGDGRFAFEGDVEDWLGSEDPDAQVPVRFQAEESPEEKEARLGRHEELKKLVAQRKDDLAKQNPRSESAAKSEAAEEQAKDEGQNNVEVEKDDTLENLEKELLSTASPPLDITALLASTTDPNFLTTPSEPSAEANALTPPPITQRLKTALFMPDLDPPDEAPDIPRINDPAVSWEASDSDTSETSNSKGDDVGKFGDDDLAAAWLRLSKVTGQSIQQLQRYRTRRLVQNNVVNQTRMGKIGSVYVLVVAGDGNGMLGLGQGKAHEFEQAAEIAKLNALRTMRPILRYENRTIYGEVRAKVSAVELTLSARPPGFGLRCSSHVFEMMRCVGIGDLSAKIHRSRNPMNVAKAVYKALTEQRDPEDVARGRGRKMVDVRRVYYAGLV